MSQIYRGIVISRYCPLHQQKWAYDSLNCSRKIGLFRLNASNRLDFLVVKFGIVVALSYIVNGKCLNTALLSNIWIHLLYSDSSFFLYLTVLSRIIRRKFRLIDL